MVKKIFIGLFFVFYFGNLMADKEQEKFYTFEVKKKTMLRKLFFGSAIMPIKKTSIVSPVDGVVVSKNIEYGQMVKKGDLLFVVSSTKLQSDYHAALTEYLNSKEKFAEAKNNFKNAESLWKLDIISRDEHESAQSALHHANINYLRALYALNDALDKRKLKKDEIKKLEISNIKEIGKVLKEKSDYLDIIASETGVALLPPASNQRNDDGPGGVEIGSTIKEGEPLTIIGDMTGVSFGVKVNEVDIHDIEKGQKAYVTGVAFPKMELEAEVTYIDAQASSMLSGGGLPTFNVILEVKKITSEQKKKLMVGMSAKIRLDIVTKKAIEIPIKAVYADHNKYFVQLKLDKEIKEIEVEPGKTSTDRVEIISGLKEGDLVVVPN